MSENVGNILSESTLPGAIRKPSYEERPSRLDGAILWASRRAGASVVAPDGCMDVLWMEDALVVAGPDDRPQAVGALSRAVVGVRLAPGDGAALLGVRASELRNRRVPLADLVDAATHRRMRDALDASAPGDAPEVSVPAGALERAVADLAERVRLGDGRARRRELTGLVSTGLSVATIARQTVWSERQLHRRSLELYGYGLRKLGRILRFQRASVLIARGVPLADVAAQCGYADQSHLSREVKDLSGRPPTGL